ncbi:MAG: YbaK/EbsC family protein [Rhizobiales bacterium]|nr:YbaK/EbsC family protein [Hyphomicrobiales bacterium]
MAELKAANQRFAERARAAGLGVDVICFEVSSRTAQEAAAACGCDVGQIVKSLVFRGARSGDALLLLVSGANRVDQDGVAAAIGEALERPDADFVRAVTGYAIGGIPPLGHDQAIRTYVDRDLVAFDRVWAAAGTPNAVFEVAPAALIEAAGASVITVT